MESCLDNKIKCKKLYGKLGNNEKSGIKVPIEFSFLEHFAYCISSNLIDNSNIKLFNLMVSKKSTLCFSDGYKMNV